MIHTIDVECYGRCGNGTESFAWNPANGVLVRYLGRRIENVGRCEAIEEAKEAAIRWCAERDRAPLSTKVGEL